MKRLITIALAAAALTGGVALRAQQPAHKFSQVTDAMLQKPDPADWLMWRRTLDGWGFSPLTQISRNNVSQLRMAWAHGLGTGNQEGTPLVHDGVMYVPDPGDHIIAIDVKTGDTIWEYRRKFAEGSRTTKTDRAIAIWGNTIINSSADNFIYALDQRTGKLVWETPVLDPKKRAPTSGGPIIANGKVITGRQCQPDAGRDSCIVTAHDAKTGKELWRFHTIPGPGEPGDESWGNVPMNERWHVGTWMVPSYDPELNLVIIGTSVTIPAPKFTLDGNDKQYLFHNCTLAINADTGKMVWYYQHIVDHWDLDHPFERLLVDTAVTPNPKDVLWINPKVKAGERRKVVTGIPGKTGVVYTIDRTNGEFLWARPTVAQNVISNIEGDGKVIVNRESLFTKINEEKVICPSASGGGKNWPAGAYSPLTNTMYMPLQNVCMTATTTTDQRDPSKVYGLKMVPQMAPGMKMVGTVWAISAETGSTTWKVEQPAGMMSLATTAGGLVFGGDANGHFKAFDDRNGKVLWDVNLGSMVSGYPVTFAADGKQYVAVITGPSLVANSDARVAPDLMQGTAPNVFVFTLP
jgi:PQQ-dependent dehydrogenase (methanol/ethanol family)